MPSDGIFQRLSEAESQTLSEHALRQRDQLVQVKALVMEATRTVSGSLAALGGFVQQQVRLSRELREALAPEHRANLLAAMEQNAQELARLMDHLVRGLQCEDLVIQILGGCEQDLDHLLDRAKVWGAISRLNASQASQDLEILETELHASNSKFPKRPGPATSSLDPGEVELF